MQKLLQDKSIGKNIRRMRKEKRLTQPDLVAMLQTRGSSIGDSTTLAKIEGGYRNIRVSDIMLLKEIFDCTYEDFFFNL